MQALKSQWIKIKAGLYAEVSNLSELALQPGALAPIRIVLGRQCTIFFITHIDLFMCVKEHMQESNL